MKTLKYAARFLMRAHSYTLINLLGLAFSLACCIVLIRYIHREMTVDTHCVDRENVYIPISEEDGLRYFSAYKTDFDSISSQIESIGMIQQMVMDQYIAYGKETYKTNIVSVDTCFFKLFHYPIVAGDVNLKHPRPAVITEEYASRVFGKENPIGKVVSLKNGKEVEITGVIGKPKNKTSIQFDLVTIPEIIRGMNTYFIRFLPGTDMDKVKEYLKQPRYRKNTSNPPPYTLSLLSVKDFYWEGNLSAYNLIFTFGEKSQILILSAICAVMLFMGILNFVNLYLIFALKRRKEYGLKKVYGISAKGMFMQIWVENLLLIGSALMVAGLLFEIFHIPLNRLLSMPFGYTSFDQWLFVGFLLILPLVTSVYPFLKYYYSPPISSVRSIGDDRQSVRGRMLLLSVQYIFTFLLIILAIYFNRQLSMLLNTKPGFRTENIMIAKMGQEFNNLILFGTEDEMEWRLHRGRLRGLIEGIKECPYVQYADMGNIMRTFGYEQTVQNDKGEKCRLRVYYVSPTFLRMYGIKFVEGNITQEEEEWGAYEFFVANQAAMKVLGYKSCKDGKVLMEADMEYNDYVEAHPIEAVVKNYYGGHLTEGYQPMLFRVSDRQINEGFYQIAYQKGRLNEVVDYLRNLQMEIYGNHIFEYTLLEDEIKAVYKNDKLVATIYTVFALIAIAISCLGLFGISLFDIRQRYREIAIRKVNGAGMKDLYKLLFRKYVVVLGIAFVIAVPIACYIIHVYTQDFVVKAPLGIGIFLIALLLVSVISLGTLYWQIHKAANINPSEVMKRE